MNRSLQVLLDCLSDKTEFFYEIANLCISQIFVTRAHSRHDENKRPSTRNHNVCCSTFDANPRARSRGFILPTRIQAQMQSLNPKSRLYDLALLLIAIAVSTSAFAYFGGAKIVTHATRFATSSGQSSVQRYQRDSETLLQEIRLDTTSDDRQKLAINSSQFSATPISAPPNSATPNQKVIVLSEAPKWPGESESVGNPSSKPADSFSGNSASEIASTPADEHSNQMLFPDFDEPADDENSDEAVEASLLESTENNIADKDDSLSKNTDLANSKPQTHRFSPQQPETLHVIPTHNIGVDTLPSPTDGSALKNSIDPNENSERRNTQFVIPESRGSGFDGRSTQLNPRQPPHAPKQNVGFQTNQPTFERQPAPIAAPADPNSMAPRRDKLRYSTLFGPKQNKSRSFFGGGTFLNQSQSDFAWPGIRK